MGYMFAVYCQSGMDSAVHVSEETVTADRGAAKNLVFSFWANSIYGFAFVLSILFSMQVALLSAHFSSSSPRGVASFKPMPTILRHLVQLVRFVCVLPFSGTGLRGAWHI